MTIRFVAVWLSVGVVAVASSSFADPIPAPPPSDSEDAAPGTATPQRATGDASRAAPHPEPETNERTANNALYLEGLGPAIFYSINYDRSFGDFAARVGFGYLSLSSGNSSGSSATASFIAVPITVSYLGVGSKRNMLELGAGATIFHVGAGASSFDSGSKESATESVTFLLPIAIIGYRFQPADGGFVFRTGITPIFGGSEAPILLPWPYLALGGAF